MPPDAELLQRYVEQRDERAFTELVRRHLGLVHAAALRRTGGRAHLAAEIAQKVFTDLARKAAPLRRHPTLTGWLYRSTRYAALDAIRAERRRQQLNQTFATMQPDDPAGNSEAEWERLRPVLDEAMDQLKETDREAMLLRYFEGLSFPELGARLSLTENAARMRTERALLRLREQLGKRGVTSTTAALALVLANRAVAAAPEGMAGSVATAALTGAAQAAGTGWLSILAGARLVTWGTVVLCLAGMGIAGWRWMGRGGVQPEFEQAADAFAANALMIYQLLARVHPGASDQPNGGGSAVAVDAGPGGPTAPREALRGFVEASRTRDVPRLAKWLTFDAQGVEVARSVHARMPAELRENLRTPEELFAFFYATDTLLSPVPPDEYLRSFLVTELKPGRVAAHPPGTPPRGLEFVLTDEGWKHEVPTPYLPVLTARILSSETLAKLRALPAAPSAGSMVPGGARAALVAFAAACNRGDAPAAAALLQFDPAAKHKALAFMAGLPPALRGKWQGPEELAADLLINGAIGNPYPAEPVLATASEERIGEQRVALLLPGTVRERLEFQETAGGWKHVITETMVDDYLQRMARAAANRP